jgi:ATP-dependent DNA helicase RecG
MSDSKEPTQRMRALVKSTDGFKLAEMDLEIRGPGAIYGQAQSGQLDLRIANLSDVKLIASVRKSAQNFIDINEKLSSYPALAKEVQRYRSVTNLN